MEKIRLYCFPYAGGSAIIYKDFQYLFNNNIEVFPVEYAGRGKRFKERMHDNIEDTIDDIYRTIQADLDKGPYAILGYSFGGLVTYELVKKIVSEGRSLPIHIFISACQAPHNKYGNYNFHELSHDALSETLMKIGGINAEVFDNKELLNLFIPIIKNDFKIYETYNHHQEKIKVPVEMSVLTASNDLLITVEQSKEWNQYTSREFRSYVIQGNHFFLHQKAHEITRIISGTLRNIAVKC